MPKRASVSRISGSTVPRSSPTTTTRLRTLSSARMRTKIFECARARRRPSVASHAVGNPVEAEEAHHVVDAQRAAVAAVLADGFGEQAVAVLAVALRSWAAGRPSPGPWGRNRRAASPRGSRRRRTGGAPTGRCRNGRWPAPDRGRGRWTGRGRARAAARRRAADRSATAGTGKTSRGASVFAGKRAFRPSRDPDRARATRSTPTDRVAAVQVLVERAIGGEAFEQFALAGDERARTACARAEPARHSRRNRTKASFRKRSLRAATRSYSTKGESRSSSISAATAGASRRRAARGGSAAKSSIASTSR